MKKILLMTDYYYPDPCANGVCLYEIANELIKRNYEVHILSINNTKIDKDYLYEGVYVHSLAQDNIYYHLKRAENNVGENINFRTLKFWRLANKLRFLLETPLYPVTLPKLANRYYAKLSALHQEHDFALYLSMFHPIHAVYASAKLKKNYPKIKLVHYSLDSMTNDIKPFHYKKFKAKRDLIYERKVHEKADLILNMKCHEKHYSQSKFNENRHKMRTVDIPLIKENHVAEKNASEKISIVYSGTLYPIRNPEYACKYFSLVHELDFTLDFFSRGSCEHILEEYEKLTNGKIKRNGYIRREKLLKIIANSDFLLSIGNANMEAIPSKIFEYISTLKPIIHFYKNDNDSCLPYLKNYPLKLLIKEGETDNSKVVKNIENFISATKHKQIRFNDIADNFEMNMPKYTVEILEELL